MYRSPSANPASFNETYKEKLQYLARYKNKTIVLVGDTNIDLIQHDKDIHAQDIINTSLSHGFTEVISRPTRITDHSATLIDHIYTNSLENTTTAGIVLVDTSDHLGTFVALNYNSRRVNGTYVPKDNRPASRKFTEENITKFQELIYNETWNDVKNENEPNEKYNKFHATYNKHYDTTFPEGDTNKNRKNQRREPKKWILPWLEDACARRDKLYEKFIREPTIQNKTKYSKMKIFCRRHIRLAKKRYYASYFKEHAANSKMQWQMINKLLNRSRKTHTNIKLKSDNDDLITAPLDVANKFNDYFSNIAATLKAKIINNNPNNERYKLNLENPVSNSINLSEVSSGEIAVYIKKLKNKSTADTKSTALKSLAENSEFTTVVASIINTSMEAGVFPDKLKVAKVCPIHKSGSKTEVSNYRPISLLPIFSKLFERVIHVRISDFMKSNNSLYESQYGFRSRHSCEHALISAQKCILDALDKKQIAMLLLIDFSKAFDMVDHTILLNKLSHYGIRGNALLLLKSYLSDRTQTVSLSGKTSDSKIMDYGVPQGSILGPLLFIIYINDIPNVCKLAKFILYADDANIFITGVNSHEIMTKYEQLSTALADWVDSNGLLLNVGKTNYMIFTNSNNIDNIQPTMRNQPIERKNVAKFLGILIDEKLTWKQHINTIQAKLSRNCGIMFRMKGILPLKTMLTLYYSFIQSHMIYCSVIWGLGSKHSLKSLFTCQKKAIRTLMPGYVTYYYDKETEEIPTHTKAMFNKLKILTIHSLILKNILIFHCKATHMPNSLPATISALLQETVMSTRPQHLVSYTNSIFIKGKRLYNEISEECNTLESPLPTDTLPRIKNHITKYLLSQQCLGPSNNWSHENYRLCTQTAIRHSARLITNAPTPYAETIEE